LKIIKKILIWLLIAFIVLIIISKIGNNIDNSDKMVLTKEEDQIVQDQLHRINRANIDKAIKEIINRLKKIPTYKYKLNFDLYKRLVQLDPDNKRFNKKYEFYKKIVNLSKQCRTIAYQEAYNTVKYPDTFKVAGVSDAYKKESIFVVRKYSAKNAFGVRIPMIANVRCYYKNGEINYDFSTKEGR